MIEQLQLQVALQQQQLDRLTSLIMSLAYSDRYVFQRKLQLLDGMNLQLGKSTGSQIGTESTQKIAFYGKTPIVQPSSISAPTSSGATYDQTVAQSAVTAINSIRTTLTNLGLTA